MEVAWYILAVVATIGVVGCLMVIIAALWDGR
jgi:hypothetical protein